MSLELAYLVTSRAPLKGDDYRILLQLALSADERDVTQGSERAIAFDTRIPRSRISETLPRLIARGYLAPVRNRRDRDPRGRYFTVIRERLIDEPVRNRCQKRFAGENVKKIVTRARAVLDPVIAEHVRALTDKLNRDAVRISALGPASK